MPGQPNETGIAVARRLVAERYPQSRAAWLGGSVAAGTHTETSDLDITVLLDGPPAPYRHSETIDGWPVEWFVQTEESLLRFCDDDRTRRRRPTTMRLVGSAVILVDTDGSGRRLQHNLHEMDRHGPPPVSFSELENQRYAVTDLLADLTGAHGDDERLTVAAALTWATADLLLAVNGRWSGSGKWLLREVERLDNDFATTHAAQLISGLRNSATGDPVPLRQIVLEILNAAGGPLFTGYRRGADDAKTTQDSFAAESTDPLRPKWATEAIEIVDADPDWEDQGKRLRDTLEVLLAPWLTGRIEHVGSTAIPGLPAKPIIDLQAAVAHLDASDSMAAVLSKHDWHYVTPDLDQRPWRRFFVKVNEGLRTAHLHVMTTDSARWRQQIAFRNALRADPSKTADYAALKRALAAEHADDREAYSAAKHLFIQAVLNAPSD
jgi:GrpB-like predicted nucleotidyltransferase (UPF0157 family)/predicted nucleotidyltransferase